MVWRPAPEGGGTPPEAVGVRQSRPDPRRVALGNLKGSIRRRAAAERAVTEGIARARQHGATWREVAALLGVTEEGARKRYR